MISGKTTRRRFDYAVPDPPRPWTGKDASQDALEQKAIGFNCLNYKKAPEDSLYRHFLPDKNYLDQNCPDGLRIEVLFPICWNGKDLDSKNHKSHMAYSDAGLNGGNCPPGFDTVVNQLFFETIYDVGAYKNRKGIFTLANGDPLGYGLHADAFIAWEAGVLQAATEQCGPVTPGSPGADGITSKCPVFDIVPEAEQRQCKMELPSAMSKMNFASDLMSLPGNNPLQYGPEDAAVNPGTPLLPTPAPPAPVEAPRPSLGYSSGSSQSTDARCHILLEATGVPAANNNNAAPAPTPAANAPSPAGEKILRTSTYTKDGAVFEVVIVEDVVTVTVDQAGETPAPVKRHAHIHEHLGRRSHVHHPRRR